MVWFNRESLQRSLKIEEFFVKFVITPFLGDSPKYIKKNNKNKIKGDSVGKKINVEILNIFRSPIVLFFCPETKENTDSRLK